jgi:hypothetical protein
MMEPAEAGVRSRRGKPTARRQIGCDSLVSDTPRTIQRKKEFSWGHSFPFKDNFLLTQIKNTKIIYQNLIKNICGLTCTCSMYVCECAGSLVAVCPVARGLV